MPCIIWSQPSRGINVVSNVHRNYEKPKISAVMLQNMGPVLFILPVPLCIHCPHSLTSLAPGGWGLQMPKLRVTSGCTLVWLIGGPQVQRLEGRKRPGWTFLSLLPPLPALILAAGLRHCDVAPISPLFHASGSSSTVSSSCSFMLAASSHPF